MELERTGGYERTSGITIVVNSRSVAGSEGDPRRGSFQPAFAEKTADEGQASFFRLVQNKMWGAGLPAMAVYQPTSLMAVSYTHL
ncbi:hypothetical protein QN401_21540, partial [Pseudomonas sp. 5S3]